MRTLRRMETNAQCPCLLLLATLIFLAAGSNFRPLHAQQDDIGADLTTKRYAKQEVRIPMRDGVTLHTTIYSPSDRSVEYPILLNRTPYGCGPYGDALADPIMYNAAMVEAGYIFVYQDLRSRSMSDGDPEFENLRPVYSQLNPDAVDEVTDAHDTIEWLLANVENHNQHVGMFGSSYMGFTALMGMRPTESLAFYAAFAEGSTVPTAGAGTTRREAGRKYHDAMPIARITNGMIGSGIASLTNRCAIVAPVRSKKKPA